MALCCKSRGFTDFFTTPILLCCHDKVGIGESNPGGHERKAGAPVKLRTASGPQATERGAKEEACEQGEAGGQSPMGHDAAAKRRCKEIGKTSTFTT